MEDKTPFNVIRLTENAALTLNNLSNDFLEIESHFNFVVSDLNNEKFSIENTSKNFLESIKNQGEQQIIDKEVNWGNGTFIPKVLNTQIDVLSKRKEMFTTIKWVTAGIGVLILFGVKWYMGFLIGGAGLLIFNGLAEEVESKIGIINSYLNGRAIYSKEDRNNLGKISDIIKEALNDEDNRVKTEIISLRDLFSSEYNVKEREELTDRRQKTIVHEQKRQHVMSELRTKTDSDIKNIKTILDNLVGLLNQIPESYDSDSLSWKNKDIFKGKKSVASNFRVGVYRVNINIDGIQHSIAIPKFFPFLNKSNICFNCYNQTETKEAIRLSHNIIGRSFLSLPANKTKITFFDPLELGGNAAPYTPLLREIYGGMVYTQADDIEIQLSALTRAIENVIQKYLQDKFGDIADYNFKTNEVPEPYRLLVVYNFPHGFNEITTRKLLNIIKSGPKAGVHTILVNDKKTKLPYGIDWKSFEEINISDISLINPNTLSRQFEFDKDLPYSEIVDYINKEFANTSIVKISFTKCIPPQSEWWKERTNKSFSVPIGRHALEDQNFKFDNNDDNQALLIGKPGSGKSNLLHVIIANSLWKYSPDQLELYLIDFKGGVEFAIYADKKIPHIRTIAIESEREFGLSVLDGVEKELLRREDKFSNTGVQNIEQYHKEFPYERMPRVLLIVDEFQEFYAEDDSIKQAVDDKFDRIVRKGRAFGINTLFSSQTLSGNSIKKSTKELIDIRVALMCSDSDSNQILDDRNLGARDLTRPGEGIYNAENGKVAGNKRFQAFFIEKEDLIKTIESVVSFANERENSSKNFKQIIFRGSEKARLQRPEGHPLDNIKAMPNPQYLRLWVGEPVTIADDVSAVIRKQGGSNLLVIGYDENVGLRVMCSSIISIAVQQQQRTCKFYSFNFYNVDSEFVSSPDELFNCIEQDCITVKSRQVKETLQSIKEEIEARLSGSSINGFNIYLTFFSFQRGRALRKDGYKMSDEGNSVAYILKEGADVGVYSLIQVDTMDNFSKNLDDNLLKEFSQRVVSQMNSDSSIKVVGSQKAAKLGHNRALYYDDNENTIIKIKPYELPAYSWVEQLQRKQSDLS